MAQGSKINTAIRPKAGFLYPRFAELITIMNFKHDLHILRATRNNILQVLDGKSLEQLNQIPDGFGNNMIWNAGHVWVTEILLIQALGGVDHGVDAEILAKYRKGSRPAMPVTQAEADYIMERLKNSPAELEAKLATADTWTYNAYTTSYGTTLSSVEEAVRFNNVHEGLHYGTLLALNKLV